MVFTPYSAILEAQMVSFFNDLPEKERRHYAAIECKKLGHGGKKYLCKLFGIHRLTLNKGLIEVDEPTLLKDIPKGKQRRSGGGRKFFFINTIAMNNCVN